MWDRIFVAMVRHLLKKGDLTLRMPSGEVIHAGDGTAPKVSVELHDHFLPKKLILNPELAMGEAYMDERLTIDGDDVRGFLTLIVHEDKQYTCSYFRDPSYTLEEAQIAKKKHIAGKLLIKPGMKVLDIGSGWGGLAITLAKDYGAQVVGVTLSDEQRKAATLRAEEAGVSHLVEFRLQDYRHVTEQFDRIVSVGMLEHVGEPQYPTYFKQIEKNLKEDGVALIHFIGRTGPPGNLSPWFQKYIFPGGYTPALSEVVKVVEKTKLEAADIEVWRTHYDRTLYEWLIRFEDRLDEVRERALHPHVALLPDRLGTEPVGHAACPVPRAAPQASDHGADHPRLPLCRGRTRAAFQLPRRLRAPQISASASILPHLTGQGPTARSGQ